tara:strand:- start:15544 stop:17595 length:2052 start_codon:yes stop_codon:yes gene_type:complete
MKWLHPEILWALFALAIPIVIHLFNFRRFKPLYFSNVQWLKEVQQETKKQSQIKHWLVLLARLIAFTFLILAFAEPFLPSSEKEKVDQQKFVSIYVDNSFSMEGQAENGRLLDIAKQYAYEIVNAYGEGQSFQIMGNNFDGADQLWLNTNDAHDRIDEIKVQASVQEIADVLQRSTAAYNFTSGGEHIIYIISDFQKTTTQLESIQNDTSRLTYFIPITPNQRVNLSIDSVWFDSPVRTADARTSVQARIHNYGSEKEVTTGVEIIVNGEAQGVRSVTVKPNNFADSTFSFNQTESGVYEVELRIKDFPVTFDNSFFLSYDIADSIPVLELYEDEQSPYLDKLFGSDPLFHFEAEDVKHIDLSKIKQQQLIVLSNLTQLSSGLIGQLNTFIESGGNVTFFPSQNPAPSKYNNLLSTFNAAKLQEFKTVQLNLSRPNLNHELFDGVFAAVPKNLNTPEVLGYYPLSVSFKSTGLTVLSLPDNSPILVDYTIGKGHFYAFSIPLDEEVSSFPKHPLFVPTLLNMGLYSLKRGAVYYTLGNESHVLLKENTSATTERIYHIQSTDTSGFDVIPEYRPYQNQPALVLDNSIEKAGFYRITNEENTSFTQPIALNYNRKESNPATYSSDELEAEIAAKGLDIDLVTESYENMASTLASISEGTPLWKWMLVGALLFVLIEILLIRFLK